MLSATMATWLLVAKLQSPFNPSEAIQWDRIYSSSNPEECEIKARSIWLGFYEHYGYKNDEHRTLTTTCQASTAHHDYKWFVTCDNVGNCKTEKYKGDSN